MMDEAQHAHGERILQWLATTDRLEAMTNAELGELLLNHIWAHMPLLSPQSDLVAEIIARLKGERREA